MIKVSVIISVADQPNSLRDCLDSLKLQTMAPDNFEVILVGSVSSELGNVRKECDASFSISEVRYPTGQVPVGLNKAIDLARGEYCLFIDFHLRPSPSLIVEHVRAQQSVQGVIGSGVVQILSGLESNSLESEKIFLRHQHQAVSSLDCRLENLSIPRKKILDAGGFSTELSKSYDLDLLYRLCQNGLATMKIDLAHAVFETEASHECLNGWEEELGAAYVELWKKHPELLPVLFGDFYDTSLRAVILRRLLLTLAVPPNWMEALGRLIWNPSWRNRWDVFMQQYCFWRGVHQALGNPEKWQQMTWGVPILAYHAFCDNDEHPSRFVHSIQHFRAQIWLLQRLGYRIISLVEYLECLYQADLPPTRSIIITIDDGYLDNYLVAYPLLLRLKIPVTIFLVSGRLGKENDWDDRSRLTGRPLFNSEAAREMQGSLITFGAHTHTHPWLRSIPLEQAREEIMLSQKELEQELGSPIRLFSYPHGDYDFQTIEIVEQAGFLGACTTQTGFNTPGTSRFELHRTEIFGTFSIFRFLTAVWGGK